MGIKDKKTQNSLFDPLIKIGKFSAGAYFYGQTGKHTGIKGKILDATTAWMKKEGWY